MRDAVPRRSRPARTVVAAVIEKEGKVLIGQRPRSSSYGGRWEFPGGKVESREDPREALARELWEELAIRAEIGEEFTRYEYQYPGRPPIQLIFYFVTRWEGEPENRAFEKIVWEWPQRFSEYDFLDGDIDLIRRLARR